LVHHQLTPFLWAKEDCTEKTGIGATPAKESPAEQQQQLPYPNSNNVKSTTFFPSYSLVLIFQFLLEVAHG
jgi:hypothetical protein